MKIHFLILLSLISIFPGHGKDRKTKVYTNPVIQQSTPDPTVLQTPGGIFYLYATENIRNTPIYKSIDLVHWTFVGTAFTDQTRPTFEPEGSIWAPDINYINGKYVLYYAMSRWGGEQTCGIGCATANSPEGPFTDHGPLFRSNEIGVQNSIDPFYIEENDEKYLFWGSFRGLYYIELSPDGLSIRPGSQPTRIAGTAYEAIYIHHRGNYYYLFASTGSCCEGDKSTYTTVVGRSKSLFGPYTDKNGNLMLDNHHEIVVHSSERFAGTGHNAEIITDRKGNDWLLYHAYLRGKSDRGRVLLLDRLQWKDGWPFIKNRIPSNEAKAPVF